MPKRENNAIHIYTGDKLKKKKVALSFLGGILLEAFVPIEGKVTANQYKVILAHHLYSMIKHFYPDGFGLFQDDNIPTDEAQWLSEWFKQTENNVNTILWPSQ